MKTRTSLLCLICTLCLMVLSACSPKAAVPGTAGGASPEETGWIKVIFSGNDDPHDLAILKERLEDHVGKGKYTLEEKEAAIVVTLDPAVCGDDTPSDFVQDNLAHRGGYSVGTVSSYDFYGMKNALRDVFPLRDLTPEDIAKTELVRREETETEETVLEGGTDTDDTDAPLRDDLPLIDTIELTARPYLDVTLTPEATAELMRLQEEAADLSLFRVKSALSVRMEDGLLRFDRYGAAQASNEYVIYNLTHERLHRSYSYRIFYDTEETAEDMFTFEFKPKNNYVPYLAERTRTLDIFRARLDALDLEYDLSQTPDGILTVHIRGDVNEALMTALCADKVSINNLHGHTLASDSSFTPEANTEQGKISVHFDSFMNDKFSGEVILMLNHLPAAHAVVEETPNGSITFTEMCFSDEAHSSFTEENPYARFLAEILSGEQLPYSMELSAYTDAADRGTSGIFTLPLPSLNNRDELMAEIRKKYPDADSHISYTDRDFRVRLHQDPASLHMEDLVKDLAHWTEMMDSRDALDMTIYPCDTVGFETFYLLVSPLYLSDDGSDAPPLGSICLNCHNGRMDDLKEEFFRAAHKQDIFVQASRYEGYYAEIGAE